MKYFVALLIAFFGIIHFQAFGQLGYFSMESKANRKVEKGKYEEAQTLVSKKIQKDIAKLDKKEAKRTKKGKTQNADQTRSEKNHYYSVETIDGSHKRCKLPYRFYKRLRQQYEIEGHIHHAKGDLQQAETELLKTDSIYKRFIYSNRADKELIYYYGRKIYLADLYMTMGEMSKAKELIATTDAMFTTKKGKEAVMGKNAMGVKARYYFLQQRYDSSSFYYEKYITQLVSDQRFIDHNMKEISDLYMKLAQSYLMEERNELAIKASRKALRYCRHRFVKGTNGKNYIGRINVYNTLSESYRVSFDYKKALKWNSKAYDIYKNHIRTGPEIFPVLATRGKLYWAKQNYDSTTKAFSDLTHAIFHYIQHNFPLLSEHERAFIFRNNKQNIELVKAYYQFMYFQKGIKDPAFLEALYEINLNSKGILLSASSKMTDRVYASNDTLLIRRYLNIRSYQEEKNKLLELGNKEEAMKKSDAISEEEKKIRGALKLEEEEYMKISDIQKAIPQEKALVDIIKVPVYLLKKELHNKDSVLVLRDSKESRYLYFIGQNHQFELVQNEVPASELETRYYRSQLNYSKFNIRKKDCYEAYWKPIEKALTKKEIVMSADGIFNLINPNQLYNGSQYLIDDYRILSVVTAKDLIRKDTAHESISDITLIGFPDFSTHEKLYSFIPADLPGTASEIESVKRILPDSIKEYTYIRQQASETTVKAIQSTSIVHFATHGYFEQAQDKDPMYTSGLILAISDTLGVHDNGYLSAYEASNLELKNTFLVVLSACETGQGKFEEGEGVWGLQRSFQVAGVRYVIMSLFKVNDEVTSLLMSQFYRNLVQGDSVMESFRKAQLTIKTTYESPAQWGAFILKGY